jgi:creatinine amidohydrolase
MSRWLGNMTYEEVQDAIDANVPWILPLGSIEQHGPHLPLSTDETIASGIANRVAEQLDVIVAPPLRYAAQSRPKSGGGRTFIGSIGMPATLFASCLEATIGECLRQGVRRVVLLNGHFENAEPAFESLEMLLGPGAQWSQNGSEARALLISWWEVLTDEEVERIFGDDFPGWPAEHAGVLETSMMEHLVPELVRSEKKARGGAARSTAYHSFPTPKDTLWPNGIGSTALPTSGELGTQVMDLTVPKIVGAIRAEFDL